MTITLTKMYGYLSWYYSHSVLAGVNWVRVENEGSDWGELGAEDITGSDDLGDERLRGEAPTCCSRMWRR